MPRTQQHCTSYLCPVRCHENSRHKNHVNKNRKNAVSTSTKNEVRKPDEARDPLHFIAIDDPRPRPTTNPRRDGVASGSAQALTYAAARPAAAQSCNCRVAPSGAAVGRPFTHPFTHPFARYKAPYFAAPDPSLGTGTAASLGVGVGVAGGGLRTIGRIGGPSSSVSSAASSLFGERVG